jgi:hypothetical protein
MAQVNLVRNPGFEQYTTCPDRWDEIKFANWTGLDTLWNPPDTLGWPWGVPDFCHTCATSNTYTGVPANGYFFHFPRTGNGLTQLQTFYDEFDSTFPQARDYLQGHLLKPLTADQSYCVTFYITLGQISHFANNNIGAYFDNGTIDTTHNPGKIQNQYTPQVLETAIINDTLNWIKVQGSFIAGGNERFITIGNFTDKAHTSFIVVRDTTGLSGGVFAAYLIDDVSVIESDAIAQAGPDRIIPIGSADSVWVGDSSGYLPCYWYSGGVKTDSNKAGFKVHPSVTTKYVMALDVCGNLSYDTVTVWIGTNEIGNLQSVDDNLALYPNPATGKLTITTARDCTLSLYDMIGREVYRTTIISGKETISVAHLAKGVYTVQLLTTSGHKVVKRVVKE